MAKRGGSPLAARTKGTNFVNKSARGGAKQPGKYNVNQFLPAAEARGGSRKGAVANTKANAGSSGRGTLATALAKLSRTQRAVGIKGTPMLPKAY